jgi:hypothetical protein
MGIMRGGRARVLASGAISAALVVTLGAAAAPAAGPRTQAGAVTNLTFGLNAVSVLSSSDAWAVGDRATVLHWNGTIWAPVTIPACQLTSSWTRWMPCPPPMSGRLATRVIRVALGQR